MLIQDEKFSAHNSNEFIQIDRSIISAPRTAPHTVTAGFSQTEVLLGTGNVPKSYFG